MNIELLPAKAVYAAGERVAVEVRGSVGERARLRVLHLGEEVLTVEVDETWADLGALPPGGYGVELVGTRSRTALEVAADPGRRHRYGFVVDYRPDRDTAAVADNVRRLHLTDVQFYDWAYRHADLLGGGEQYDDALSQPISLDTVRRLVTAVQEAGSRALGYAAVYAVGNGEWDTWSDLALLTPSGPAYSLGDFLQLVDPAAERWTKHLAGELERAVASIGFDGFHLDQYGYPKHARRADGTSVVVEESFATLIDAMRAALPQARLVFNNVNDFPTWRTAELDQDAVYVEVWPPQITLQHLADTVTRARSLGGDKPVVVAAYQHVYDTAPAPEADLATAYTMATLYSHGATQLLCGEADRLLVDPYYVRNHIAEVSTTAMLRRWYDFLVEHVELLDGAFVDVTSAMAGPYNDDCDVDLGAVPVDEHAAAGTVWRRVVADGARIVVHLINLADQIDVTWDAPRRPVTARSGRLRVRRAGPAVPRVRVADPDGGAALVDLPVRSDGDHAVADLPELKVWQMIVIDLATTTPATR